MWIKNIGIQCFLQRGFEFEEEAVTIAKRFLLNTGPDFGGIINFILCFGIHLFRLDHEKITLRSAPVDDDVRGDVFHGPVAVSPAVNPLGIISDDAVSVEFAIDIPAGKDLLEVEPEAEREGTLVHIIVDQIPVVEVETAQRLVHGAFNFIGFRIAHHFTS